MKMYDMQTFSGNLCFNTIPLNRRWLGPANTKSIIKKAFLQWRNKTTQVIDLLRFPHIL